MRCIQRRLQRTFSTYANILRSTRQLELHWIQVGWYQLKLACFLTKQSMKRGPSWVKPGLFAECDVTLTRAKQAPFTVVRKHGHFWDTWALTTESLALFLLLDILMETFFGSVSAFQWSDTQGNEPFFRQLLVTRRSRGDEPLIIHSMTRLKASNELTYFLVARYWMSRVKEALDKRRLANVPDMREFAFFPWQIVLVELTGWHQ